MFLGDCRDVLPIVGRVDAVVTDPPYGVLNLEGKTSAIRKSRRINPGRFKGMAIASSGAWDVAPDNEVFDLLFAMSDQQIIWGANYFPLPPTRGILVWDKEQPWPNFSQAEVAWTSTDRPAAVFRLNSARGAPNKQHPAEKPLALMKWCIDRLPNSKTICDPFMGSGTTGVAAVAMGRQFIGIERDVSYFDIACRRIREVLRQPDMFIKSGAG